MFTYTLRRLLFAIPTLLIISFIIFALLDLAPSDPLSDLPLTIPPEVRAQIREAMGLDQPFFIRYLRWLQQFFVNEPLNIFEQITGINGDAVSAVSGDARRSYVYFDFFAAQKAAVAAAPAKLCAFYGKGLKSSYVTEPSDREPGLKVLVVDCTT